MLGTDFCLEGLPSETTSVLHALLGRGGSWLDSYAWETLGFVAVRSGVLGDAAACYETAARSDRTRVIPALYWLRFGLLAESRDSAVRAAAFIDRFVHHEDPALSWFRRLGEVESGPRSSPDQRALARLIADQSGPVSWKVIDGFK
jgi:hypothetical protein